MTATLDAAPGLPVTVNLTAYHGDAWSQPFRFLRGDVPLDLSGYEATAACRAPAGDVFPMVATIGEDPGVVALSFALGTMPEARDYRYDVQLTDSGGGVTTWVAGRLRVARDVTSETLPG